MVQMKVHILVACYPAQGHINPTLCLSKRLARETGAHITFSTAIGAHRRMFPSPTSREAAHDSPLISYIPYSDGHDDGIIHQRPQPSAPTAVCSHLDLSIQCGSVSLASILDDLSTSGLPVTHIIYSFLMSWVADVARSRGIPFTLFWIQSATAFAIYWHYFHDYKSIIGGKANEFSGTVNLPRLPSMRVSNLPSFVTVSATENIYILRYIRSMFDVLDVEGMRPRVIANAAEELEESAIASVADAVSVLGIGPLLGDATEESMFRDDESGYLEWLDGRAERSVVYVSFGSIVVMGKEEVEEVWNGLRECGRPFLWVVRKDLRWEGAEFGKEEGGMVVEWCLQKRVLEHKAVGCFVTHCGWNSTGESLLYGVPTVALPLRSDQTTNAWLMEAVWGTGVRVSVGKDGFPDAEELGRGIELVMGKGERQNEIRRNVEMWKEMARRAISEGGSSCRNLKAFADEIICSK